jgi:hypothetical protein
MSGTAACVVYVLEDQAVVRKRIVQGLREETLKVKDFTDPQSLLMRLRDSGAPEHRAVLIADLYAAGYWRSQAPRKGPAQPTPPSNPLNIKLAVLDNIQQYLVPFHRDFKLPIIIYSHIFLFFENKERGEWAAEVREALHNIGIPDEDIISKARIEGAAGMPEEIGLLVDRVRVACARRA